MRARDGADGGFTLIELLVVVVIIGVLAAIAIPTFVNQRRRGWEAANKSEIRSVTLALESYAADNDGQYLTVDSTNGTGMAALEAQGYRMSAVYAEPGGAVKVKLANPTTYCVEIAHPALVDYTRTTPLPWGYWAKTTTMSAAALGYCSDSGVHTS